MSETTPATTETHPACSICIANYNGAGIVRDCIESVLAQEGCGPIEIIVHDDASDDDSVALLSTEYPQIRLLRSDSNVGFCIANNRMVSQAHGEFVLLLNNDAALMPDALQILIDAARSRPLPAILTLPQYDWRSGELVDRGCLLDPFYNPVPNLDAKRSDVAMVIGACLFLPRALWTKLGGFPDWMESIAEDMYLCCAARLRGHAVLALAKSGYRHRRGVTFSGARSDANQPVTTFRRRRLSERNKTATLFVCTPTMLMWPLLALHLLLLLIEGAAISSWRADFRVLTGIYVGVPIVLWRRRGILRMARKETQAARAASVMQYFGQFLRLPYKLALLVRYGMPRITR